MEVIKSIPGVILQMHTMMPESILFGSMLLYFITLNKPFGVFAIFILELILSHKLISWIFKETGGPSRTTSIDCMSGYKTARFNIDRIIPSHQYPSYAVFSITSIATYLGMSTYEFSDTMKSMGAQWDGRAKISYLFIIAMLIAFIAVRLSACESPGEIAMAVGLAVIAGLFFFKLNMILFGKEGINFLGLPYMVSKDSVGNKIYVCSKSKDPVPADQCRQ
jgi:hypothetical protein